MTIGSNEQSLEQRIACDPEKWKHRCPGAGRGYGCGAYLWTEVWREGNVLMMRRRCHLGHSSVPWVVFGIENSSRGTKKRWGKLFKNVE